MTNIMIHKSAWKFIDGARSKDDAREVLQQVYIDPADGIIATNGRMLAKLDPDQAGGIGGLEPGAYEIIAQGKPDKAGYMILGIRRTDNQFPDYKKVIPEKPTAWKQLTVAANAKKASLAISRLLIELYEYTGSAFDLEYLLVLGALTDTWAVGKAEKDKAAYFSGPGQTMAVVLPFKVN